MKMFFVIYTVVAAACALLLLVSAAIRRSIKRRERHRDRRMERCYLRIMASAAFSPEAERDYRLPGISHPGARMTAVKVLCRLADSAYYADSDFATHYVDSNSLDEYLARKVERSRSTDRAYYMALMSRLPVRERIAERLSRFKDDKHREVRFYLLLVQMSASPMHSMALLREYDAPLSPCELAQVMTMLQRGAFTVAYAPLLDDGNRNLRMLGLEIVRHYGIEEAAERLIEILDGGCDEEMCQAIIYTLGALRRGLSHRTVGRRMQRMDAATRKSYLRMLAREGFGVQALNSLFANGDRPYFESLTASYKSMITCK